MNFLRSLVGMKENREQTARLQYDNNCPGDPLCSSLSAALPLFSAETAEARGDLQQGIEQYYSCLDAAHAARPYGGHGGVGNVDPHPNRNRGHVGNVDTPHHKGNSYSGGGRSRHHDNPPHSHRRYGNDDNGQGGGNRRHRHPSQDGQNGRSRHEPSDVVIHDKPDQ
jgi:hypothetical protein